MPSETFLTSGLLAVTAITAPASSVSTGHEKRFKPGWCTFHLHQDESNIYDTNPTNKTEISDGQGNDFYTSPQQNF